MSQAVFAHAAYGIGLYGQDDPAPDAKVLARLEKFQEAADAAVTRLCDMYAADDVNPDVSDSMFLARLQHASKSKDVAIDPMLAVLKKAIEDDEDAGGTIDDIALGDATPDAKQLVYAMLHAADFQGLKTWLEAKDIHGGHWMYTYADDDGGDGSATPADSWIFGFGLYAFPMKSFPKGLDAAGARWHTWVTAG